jgi:hypothetical protein
VFWQECSCHFQGGYVKMATAVFAKTFNTEYPTWLSPENQKPIDKKDNGDYGLTKKWMKCTCMLNHVNLFPPLQFILHQ